VIALSAAWPRILRPLEIPGRVSVIVNNMAAGRRSCQHLPMQSRSAIVIVPIVAIVVGGAATMLLLRRAATAPPIAPTIPVPTTASTGPSVAVPPSAAPEAHDARPLGGEFLRSWAESMPAASRETPRLFLLSSAELSSRRYGWEMPALATAMARELSAVLAEGCRTGCGATVEHARTRLEQFLDADEPHHDAPRTTRSPSEGLASSDVRSISIRSIADAVSIEVTCRCESWTLGMRLWNDRVTCDARLLDRGRSLLRYSPRVKLGSDHQALDYLLEAYRQEVTFEDGTALAIESGYNYSEPSHADLENNTPQRRLDIRRSKVWSKKR
jgi:hypothetical protein